MQIVFDDFVHYLEVHDLSYIVLIVLLFIVPRILGRIGVPLPMGAFIMGFFSSTELNLFSNSEVVQIFALLGISSLFLYAGLEVNFNDLKENSRILTQHIVVRILTIFSFVGLAIFFMDLSFKVSTLIALAILTPSTGFILESLHSIKISDDQKMWVKLLAISSEIVALIILILIQGSSPIMIGFSIITILILALALPLGFRWVANRVSIKTPGADFSFLLLLAVAVGTLTKKMGAYYLVGAFLVGFTVNFYEKNIAHTSNKELEAAARFFAAFFMPFYFFNTGLKLNSSTFSIDSFGVALIFIAITLPIRIGSIILHRRITKAELPKSSLPIAITLLPTLVFGLVMVEILEATGQITPTILGGVVIYTLIMTMVPSAFLRLFLKNLDLTKQKEL